MALPTPFYTKTTKALCCWRRMVGSQAENAQSILTCVTILSPTGSENKISPFPTAPPNWWWRISLLNHFKVHCSQSFVQSSWTYQNDICRSNIPYWRSVLGLHEVSRHKVRRQSLIDLSVVSWLLSSVHFPVTCRYQRRHIYSILTRSFYIHIYTYPLNSWEI